jgi:hypothetical protein
MIELHVATGKYPVSSSKWLYSALPATSPVLQLLVDFRVYSGNKKLGGGDDVENGPREFWVAIAKGLIEEDRDKRPWLDHRCRYHIHTDEAPKCT